MKNERRDVYIARSLGLMNYLVMKGYPVTKVEDSYRDRNKKVFIFDYDPQLQKLAQKYIDETRGEAYGNNEQQRKNR